MTDIIDLPNELIESVTVLLFPEDSLAFALTCKHIYWASQPTLSHHHRMSLKYKDQTQANDLDIWELTRDLVKDPSLSAYVRHLDLQDRRSMYDNKIWLYGQWTPGTEEPPPDIVNVLIDATHKTLPFAKCLDSQSFFQISRNDSTKIHTQLTRGLLDPVLAILMTLLPEVKSLRLDRDSIDNPWLYKAYQKIALAHGTKSGAMDSLAHLAILELDCSNMEAMRDEEWVFLSLAFPSIRSVRALKLSSGLSIVPSRSLPFCSTSLSALNLDNCNLAQGNLVALLRCTPNLKQFRYCDGGSLLGEIDFHPRFIAQAVAATLSDSLQELIIQDEGNEPVFSNDEFDALPLPISFSHFRRLRSLTCALAVLTDADNITTLKRDHEARASLASNPLTIARTLPFSIKTLHLFPPQHGWDGGEDAVLDLLQNNSAVLGSLTLVRSNRSGHDKVELEAFASKGLDEVAKRVGVEYCSMSFDEYLERGAVFEHTSFAS